MLKHVLSIATVIASAIFFATSCNNFSRDAKATPKNVTEAKSDLTLKEANAGECKHDGDCLLVKAGCCGCNEGGKQIALNQEMAKKQTETINSTCGDTMCPQMISKDPSCQQSAKCNAENKCDLGDSN